MDYLNNSWSPVSCEIVRDSNFRKDIDSIGYKIANVISKDVIAQLTELFYDNHDVSDIRGGTFYSVYSKDANYRVNIHQKIKSILQPTFDNLFRDYRLALGAFVVKYPGPQSEFALHQDGSGVDEFKFSPLNVWIPLQDVGKENGAVALIPHSQKFFSPYRHISFPTPYQNIQSTVRSYLKIIDVKKGEALLFDNRLLHNSVTNISEQPRIVVVCGLIPKDASLITCFKPQNEYFNKVELIENEDEFLLKYPEFLENCHIRPTMGKSLGWVDDNYGEISKEDFITLCQRNGVEVANEVEVEIEPDLNLIGEPDHTFTPKKVEEPVKPKGILSRLKDLIN